MSNTGKIRLMIVAPGPKSEGGIKSVVSRIYPRLLEREDMEVIWIASQRSGSALAKIACWAGSFLKSLFYLPRCSVVHLHGSVRLSLLRKSTFIWPARLFGCRIVYHFHAPQSVFEQFFERHGFIRNYALATLGTCDAIVVLSDSWKETVRKVLPNSEIIVIYNPVMDTEGEVTRKCDNGRDVLYLAHLIRRKGFDDLIKAFAQVVAEVPDARLVFCGSGETDYAKELGDKLGISANIVFRGWIPESGIADQLAAATVFCLPSYDEGLPMGILEAMSSGVAVVTTPVGGVPDVLTHERNALLVKPGDVPDLGKQLTRLLQDASLRKRLSEEALRDSVAFRPDRISEEWAAMYNSLATGQRVMKQ
jgi:glycosyltransferase involved in cell wall biosynthesis